MAEGDAPLPGRAAGPGRRCAGGGGTGLVGDLRAEGSDWFWWYGPDFTIDTDFLFDELFRCISRTSTASWTWNRPRISTSRSACQRGVGLLQAARLLSPDLSGESEHYFDWLGAGQLDLTRQATAMFQGDRIGQKLCFGFGGDEFFSAARPQAPSGGDHPPLPCCPTPSRVTLRQPTLGRIESVFETSEDGVHFQPVFRRQSPGPLGPVAPHGDPPAICSRVEPGHEFAFFVQLLETGLQRERFPERGAIEITAPSADFRAEQWFGLRPARA